MKLYGFPPSPNTWKVRALAAHVGVPIEFEMVDLTKRAQKLPSYLDINPLGRTPTLVDGGFKLWESTAIMQYIAAQKQTPVYPEDARARADILRWQSWQMQHWAKACEPLLFERIVKSIFALGAADPAAIAQAESVFQTEGKMLDTHLAGRTYLVGDTLTLADFSVASYLFHAERAQFPLQPYANVRRWFGTVSALPAWKQTAPG